MSLDTNKVRMQDIRNLFRYYTATPLGRLVTLQFLMTNWDEINARYKILMLSWSILESQ